MLGGVRWRRGEARDVGDVVEGEVEEMWAPASRWSESMALRWRMGLRWRGSASTEMSQAAALAAAGCEGEGERERWWRRALLSVHRLLAR